MSFSPNLSGINFNTNIAQLTFPSNFPITGGTSIAPLIHNETGIGLFWNETGGQGETDIICYGQGGGGGLSIWGGPSFSTPPNTTPVSRIADLWGNQIKFYQDVSFNENVVLSANSLLTFNNPGGGTSSGILIDGSLNIFSTNNSNNYLYLVYSNNEWNLNAPTYGTNLSLNFVGSSIGITASNYAVTTIGSLNFTNSNGKISFTNTSDDITFITTNYGDITFTTYNGANNRGSITLTTNTGDITLTTNTGDITFTTNTGSTTFEDTVTFKDTVTLNSVFQSASQSTPTNLTSNYGTFYNNGGNPYFAYNNGTNITPYSLLTSASLSDYATLSGGTASTPQSFSGYNTFNDVYFNTINFTVGGQIIFPDISSLPYSPPAYQAGIGLSWNKAAGSNGETDIICYGQSGQGGLTIWGGSTDSSTPPNVNRIADLWGNQIKFYQDVSFNNNVTCTSSISASSFSTTSDYRIKENVTELNENYSVDNLRPVEYENKITNKQSLGFIAHEVQEQYPFLVTGEKDGKENQSINYQEIIPILVKEIQDLKKRVTLLEN